MRISTNHLPGGISSCSSPLVCFEDKLMNDSEFFNFSFVLIAAALMNWDSSVIAIENSFGPLIS